MQLTKNITQYQISYMSGGTEVPLIDCYDGTTHVAKLSFHPDPVPANQLISTGVVYLRYRLSQFNDVIGILRLESPLKITFSDTSLKGALFTGANEPVGEQET
jgi:hypothetical protein